MNVTLKALVVAAVATMSVSGVANAAVADNFSGANGNLYFSLMDTSTQASVLINLGNAPGFAALDSGAVNASGYKFDWDLSSVSQLVNNFSSILNASTTKWGVFTASASVSNGAKRVITTVDVADVATLKIPTSNNVGTDAGNLNALLINQNGQNVVYYPSLGLGNKNPQNSLIYGAQGKIGANIPNVAWGNVDSSLNIAEYTAGKTGTTATATLLSNANGNTTFTFGSDYKLHLVAAAAVAPAVPEADALSMMMAGLGLMGLVVVRRKQQG